MREYDPSVGAVRLLAEAAEIGQLQSAVARALGPTDELGVPWVVQPLFPETPDPQLATHWTISGTVPAGPAYDASQVAYDLAAELSHELGAPVEPDLPSSAYGAEPGEEPAFESLGDTRGTHLTASDQRRWAVEAVRAHDA